MFRRTPGKLASGAIKASLLGAVLVASVLPDHLLNLVCRSGVVMAADACCPAEKRVSGQAAWRDEACCALRAVDLDRAVPDRPGPPAPLLRAAVLLPAATPQVPPLPRLMAQLPPPPPRGPPIAPLLLKSSFLL